MNFLEKYNGESDEKWKINNNDRGFERRQGKV
jgi:hypothetical protein